MILSELRERGILYGCARIALSFLTALSKKLL